MALSAEHLRRIATEDRNTLVKAFRATLVDFGYPITPEYVGGVITAVLAGEKQKGGPAMFIERWLTEGMD